MGRASRSPTRQRAANTNSLPASADERLFTNTVDDHHKFWAIARADDAILVRFGRIGTTGQAAPKKRFADRQAAAQFSDELVNDKVAKGYIETRPLAPLRVPTAEEYAILDDIHGWGLEYQLHRAHRAGLDYRHGQEPPYQTSYRSMGPPPHVEDAVTGGSLRCAVTCLSLCLLTTRGWCPPAALLPSMLGVVGACMPRNRRWRVKDAPLVLSWTLLALRYLLQPSAAASAWLDSWLAPSWLRAALAALPPAAAGTLLVGGAALEAALLLSNAAIPYSIMGLASCARLLDTRTLAPPSREVRTVWLLLRWTHLVLIAPFFPCCLYPHCSWDDPIFSRLSNDYRSGHGALPTRNSGSQSTPCKLAHVVALNTVAWGRLRAFAAAGFSPRIDVDLPRVRGR